MMSVAGFSEALDSAVILNIDDKLSIPVATIPALVILKLFAWIERRFSKENHDATDIWILIESYKDAGTEDRMYKEESVIFIESGYDLDLASAKLLGKDAAQLCKPDTHAKLIFEFNDKIRNEFIEDIVSQRPKIGADHFNERVMRLCNGLFDSFEHNKRAENH
jgi:predicted nucleotidyltransferase